MEQNERLIQQHLSILLHAQKCVRRENKDNVNGEPCGVMYCDTMSDVLNHLETCEEGKACTYDHCASSRQTLIHFGNCQREDCPVCPPLRNIIGLIDLPVFKTEANLIQRRNAKILEQIENEEIRKQTFELFSCKICFDELSLYSCQTCWKGFCQNCHENLEQAEMTNKCPFCNVYCNGFDIVRLPRT